MMCICFDKTKLFNSHYFRALSSVGSEHLVYTQGVRGSNPLAPTKTPTYIGGVFYLITLLIFR